MRSLGMGYRALWALVSIEVYNGSKRELIPQKFSGS